MTKEKVSEEQELQEHQEHEQEYDVRVQKVKQMRADGIEPWPVFQPINATCKDVLDEYQEEKESREYAVAGRVMTLREHGKSAFAHVQDRTAKLQVYFKQDILGEQTFEFLKHSIDIGDIIWIAGASFKTRTGEITLKATKLKLLSKCLHPLPEKFHGIADVEIKYRQRYLDLISDPESRERFKKRAEIIRTMRQFFDAHQFMEVETPMLHPIPGGAVARPFVTHHNTLDMELFLRIAPELYLKKLVIGGLERVYEINRCFRNEGISTKHNPEFTTAEFYAAHLDYQYMMDFVEKMLKRIVQDVCESPQVTFGEYTLDFEKPFERLTMKQAVMKYGNLTENDLSESAIDATLKKHKTTVANKNASWGEKLNALFEELVESKLIQPTFITEYPVEVSPLAKRNPDNPAFVDRFELFAVGMELGNAFSELNDPFDQAERFRQQAQARTGGDQEAHHYDADYVLALEYGLPPTVGVGIGIDRLTMLLTDTSSIKDVILFPTLKKK